MAKQLQLRRGTTSQHSTFTGANGEVTIDTDKKVVVVHDGTTVGGVPLAKQTTVDTKVSKVTSTDNAIVRFDGTTGEIQNSLVTVSDIGSITFPAGARITGDFSNATASNRVLFQTNTANSNTIVAAVPNGTAITSLFSAYSGTDIDNSSSMSILCTTGDSSLRASRNGTGAYTPMTFYTNGSEKFRIDTAGNVLVTNVGGLGYGTGSGGTVTQLTNKSTAVTLNKPTGQIIMNGAALAAGASVTFTFNNSLLTAQDFISLTMEWNATTAYRIEQAAVGAGTALIRVTNISGSSLSEAIQIKFNIIKGAIS